MTKDQLEDLQAIANSVMGSRDALLRFCSWAEREDIGDLGDGLPGSILYSLVSLAECMAEMDVVMRSLHAMPHNH